MNYRNFDRILLHWNQTQNNRQMPWKGEKNPYKIWLSEVILQQTRVEQGLRYYHNFIENYPTVTDLANAEEKKVFKLWEGLGYYSRCKNLIQTAKTVSTEFNGKFPDTYEVILKLKGIGPYTAAAIASFAFDLPHAVIDGNVFRVLSRIFGIREPIDTTAGKKLFTALAEKLLDKEQPGLYNQAIMDFGATVCKPSNPLCNKCPFRNKCVAFQKGLIETLPVKSKKIAVRTRYFYYFLPAYRNQLPVRERLGRDIWQHLYEFPIIETDAETDTGKIIKKAVQNGWMDKAATPCISPVFSQKLSHQLIKAVFISYKTKTRDTAFKNYQWVTPAVLQTLPFPKTITQYLNRFLASRE
ncbi:A/G-specific adenine glycosylase [Niabella ginsenosidivorans]|uniref:Adenine DNA glycosylase n=1 Tax=Niabella ginsenosidivorans TaxID=1176587 RepID=A0A1A9I8E6_9BACT|nr:A/G-specific adenine glycosylase [Niabella ginsenosidivorans]ANH82932.1 A/G-specific adenine glycosylase [Niabella ginsenosidivorans]